MMQILLLLTYYETNISIYNSPFKKLSYLAYGFNNKANYTINFINFTSDFVFGLGTQEEFKYIEKIEDYQKFCKGLEPLSKIQFFITSPINHSGKIAQKNILTPYSISCYSNYSFTVGFDYQNKSNHLDYHLQPMILITIIFIIFVFVLTLLYILIMFCFTKNPFNNQQFLLILTFSLHNAILYVYLNSKKSTEFIETYNFKDNINIRNFLELLSIGGIVLSLIFIFSNSYIRYMKNKKKKRYTSAFSLLIIPIIIISSIFPLMMLNGPILLRIIVVVLLFIFSLIITFMRPACTLSKFGFFIYLNGIMVTSPAISILHYFFGEKVSMNYVIYIDILIFIAMESASIIVLMISFTTEKIEANDRTNLNSNENTGINLSSTFLNDENNQVLTYTDDVISNSNRQELLSNPYSNIY